MDPAKIYSIARYFTRVISSLEIYSYFAFVLGIYIA